MDTANNVMGPEPEPEKPPGPVTSLVLSYPKQPTMEQRVARLERLVVSLILLAVALSLACVGMIWAFLTKFGVI